MDIFGRCRSYAKESVAFELDFSDKKEGDGDFVG